MIKLIASDMDGTLLPEGTPDINPELFKVILKLKEKGIMFVAASGRQFESMRGVFGKIEKDILFIADNGAYVICRGQLMKCRSFERGILEEIVDYVRHMEDIFCMVSTPDGAYTDNGDDEEMVKWIREGYHVELDVVEDILKLDKDIMKVAIFCKGIDAAQVAKTVEPRFAGKSHVMVSGEHWIDFMEAHADKGNALSEIQQMMGIKKEETMAFGDNLNDIGLLSCAKESFAVAGAREEVKKAAAYVLTDTSGDAVLNELKKLL